MQDIFALKRELIIYSLNVEEKDLQIRYIGNFPPPYGGVTRKNQLLFNSISEKCTICKSQKFRWMPNMIAQIFNMFNILRPDLVAIIGISATQGKSRVLTKLFYLFNRKSMRRSLYFMMGGTESDRIANSAKEIKWYSNYKKIYVEVLPMLQKLEKMGMKNVELFPNCRKRPEKIYKINDNKVESLRCIFLSNIQENKGADLIIGAAELLPDVKFDFYGHVEQKFEEWFLSEVDRLDNVKYNGIYKGKNEEIYNLLNQYDVLLLPTRWKTEGVPGVLVEGKIAGVAEIVSNESYNAYIVNNGTDGIVMYETSKECLVEAIKSLDSDRNLLYRFKQNSQLSAEQYYIENYINGIILNLN